MRRICRNRHEPIHSNPLLWKAAILSSHLHIYVLVEFLLPQAGAAGHQHLKCGCHQGKALVAFSLQPYCSTESSRLGHSADLHEHCWHFFPTLTLLEPIRRQKQEMCGAGCRLGSSGKSPGLAPETKLLHFGPFPLLETSHITGLSTVI